MENLSSNQQSVKQKNHLQFFASASSQYSPHLQETPLVSSIPWTYFLSNPKEKNLKNKTTVLHFSLTTT